jgi:hypothetical protein
VHKFVIYPRDEGFVSFTGSDKYTQFTPHLTVVLLFISRCSLQHIYTHSERIALTLINFYVSYPLIVCKQYRVILFSYYLRHINRSPLIQKIIYNSTQIHTHTCMYMKKLLYIESSLYIQTNRLLFQCSFSVFVKPRFSVFHFYSSFFGSSHATQHLVRETHFLLNSFF